MTDSSWDNNGMSRPAKTGWPVWAKLLMGCGIVVALCVTACLGGIATCANALNQTASAEWTALRAIVQQLETDDGARAVYAANPDLAGRFPDAEAFLQKVRAWRPRLEPLPLEKPGITSGKLDMNVSINNGHRTASLIYKNGKGAHLAATWADGRLADISVE